MTADTRPVAQEAADRLRELVRPGDTLTVVWRGVSRSGSFKVGVFAPGEKEDLTYAVAQALGLRHDSLAQAVYIGDSSVKSFVRRLSATLYGPDRLRDLSWRLL